MCDKPMTFDLAQAEELAKVVQKTGVVFGVTHNYTGYPLVRQARDMVQAGELGEINAVRAFYIQGWLRTRLERGGSRRSRRAGAPTRSAPAPPAASATSAPTPTTWAASSPGCCPTRFPACCKTFVPGRELDDYGTAVIRYTQRRARHGDGVADLARPGERPVDRGRRHQGRRWNGTRRSRTSCSSGVNGQPHRSTPATRTPRT